MTVVPPDCAVLLRSWRTKDGGIMSEMCLSMRVPIVSPANDEYSFRELPLTEWREKYRRVRKEGVHLIKSSRRSALVEDESSLIQGAIIR